jgi:hypothetical protein
VWTRGGANQVFSRNVTAFVNGSLNILLSPDRNGLVLFRAQFVVSRSCNVTNCLSGNKNGDSLETCASCDKCIVSSTNVLTAPHVFLLDVLPVNDRPSFQLGEKNSALVSNEDDPILIENFAIQVSNGGWKEEDQLVTFTVLHTSGWPLFDKAEVECVEGKNKPCSSGFARLVLVPIPNRFGKVSYTLTMRDSGGTDHGGVDTSFSQTFTVEVFPKNDPPSFSLSVSDVIVRQDTGCILEPSMSWVDLVVEPACDTITDRTQNLTHVYPGFVISMDMGPYENGPLPDFGAGGNLWTLAGVCETGPCEHQFAQRFIVEPVDEAQAHTLLKKLPSVSVKGTLEFESRWYVTGEAHFRLRVLDSGTIDLSKVPPLKVRSTTILSISNPKE